MKFYLYDEVVVHDDMDDFWVVIHKNVLNLTPLLTDRKDHWNKHMDYLLAFGGKDLSHFFHQNGLPKTETSPITGSPRVLFPPILEVALSNFNKTPGMMWSQDPFYHIGFITRKPRCLRIINTLTGTTQQMKVCDEDSIYDIQRKYKECFNHHAGSYIWRKFSKGGSYDGSLLLHGTLDENGLTEYEDSNYHLPPPSLWLYYTNDLTVG